MKKEYPLNKNIKNHLLLGITLCLWVFVFLFFAEPFDIHKFTTTEKLIFLPVYGVIQGICYCLPIWYQNKFKNSVWRVKNELIFIVLMIVVGFGINFLFYKNIVAYNEPDTYEYYHYFKWIYAPALAIILPFIIIGRYVMGKFFENEIKTDKKKIIIKGKGKYDLIILHMDELVFIHSSDNYVDVFFIEKNILKKKTLRETLSGLEKSFTFLMKTHRSFLINPNHFKQFKIENKKLYIDIGFGKKIPVSRNLQTSIKSKLPITTNK